MQFVILEVSPGIFCVYYRPQRQDKVGTFRQRAIKNFNGCVIKFRAIISEAQAESVITRREIWRTKGLPSSTKDLPQLLHYFFTLYLALLFSEKQSQQYELDSRIEFNKSSK